MAGLEERLWSRREDRAREDCLGKAKRSAVLALRCENNPLNQSNPTLKIQWEIHIFTFSNTYRNAPKKKFRTVII